MTEAQLTRTCTKCRQTRDVEDFAVTSARGKPYVRAWCNGCLAAYFKARNARRKAERGG